MKSTSAVCSFCLWLRKRDGNRSQNIRRKERKLKSKLAQFLKLNGLSDSENKIDLIEKLSGGGLICRKRGMHITSSSNSEEKGSKTGYRCSRRKGGNFRKLVYKSDEI